MSKYIFLDIDGVLNCNNTTDDCFGMTGIEDRLVQKLSTIVKVTGAEIVLTSTWRDYWEPLEKGKQDAEGVYLDCKLEKYGLVLQIHQNSPNFNSCLNRKSSLQ